MNPAEVKKAEKNWVEVVTGTLSRWLIQALCLILLWLIYWQGQNMVNAAVEKSPLASVVAATKLAVDNHSATMAAIKGDVDQAKSTAERAVVTQDKIFTALHESSVALQNTNLSVATLTERIDGVKQQLDRIESKQPR